ncbi:MAG TPA: enoyl-CoA hydratase-related protein [Candidatus Binataceae bacterium]|nr:enoyl-CoA hydratase-related protein [Candidatus Binataceae bacterium]
MPSEQIRIDIKDSIATLTLNRPEKLNAITGQMGRDLDEAYYALDHNDAVRVIIVTGAGRAFCAGADLSSGSKTFDREGRENFSTGDGPKVRPWNIRKPIIAAINGPAVGAGASLALQYDIRVAAESARVGLVYVRRGIIPEGLAAWTLPRLVGLARASELLLSGRILNAREALEYGLVSHVWADAEFMARTRELAAEIAVNTSPVSVAISKRLMYNFLTEPEIEKAQAVEDQIFWWIGNQPDAGEGITAFLEKRKPQWKSKPRDMPDFVPPVK